MTRRRPFLLPALAAGLLFGLGGAAPRVDAQTFGVGLAGSVVNDTGTAANVGGFDNAAFHVFGEMWLEENVLLQARYSRFGLPRPVDNSPGSNVDAGLLSVGYLFREEWFRAGFQAGIGVYHIAPQDLAAGQVPGDPRQDVFGLHGGVTTIFTVSDRLRFRIEASFHTLRSENEHKPIFLTGGVSYHF